MKRFIRYLFEYGQEEKLRNVGFVKVEQGDQAAVIHIHGKGLGLKNGSGIRIYLIYEENGGCVGILLGNELEASPALNVQLSYTADSVGVPENYERICGVMLVSLDGRRFAAMWNDGQPRMNLEQMQEWREQPQPEEQPEENMEPQMLEDETELQEAGQAVEESDFSESDTAIEESVEEILTESVEVQAPPRWKITKIQRGEISILPRSEWRLANNNFLMHGYYNYRHLVLIDDGNVLKIGVPGIYHEKEARAAAAFGFLEFIGEEDANITLRPEERNVEQQFGYWCRQVRRPSM